MRKQTKRAAKRAEANQCEQAGAAEERDCTGPSSVLLFNARQARESVATAAVPSAASDTMTKALAGCIWPDNLGDLIHLRIFGFCVFPVLPHCSMTCHSFRALIQPELASGTMPHLRAPRDTPTVQRAIKLSPRDYWY